MYAAQHAVATQTKAAQTDLAGALSGGKAEKSGVVRLRGAPFDVSRNEVADFFADFGVDESQVFLAPHVHNGRPSGEAFVVLAEGSEGDVMAALDKREIRGRWLELGAGRG